MEKQNKNRTDEGAETVCKHCNKGRKEGRIDGRKEKSSKEGKKGEKAADLKELWKEGMNKGRKELQKR